VELLGPLSANSLLLPSNSLSASFLRVDELWRSIRRGIY
jgi:hypothetical protein